MHLMHETLINFIISVENFCMTLTRRFFVVLIRISWENSDFCAFNTSSTTVCSFGCITLVHCSALLCAALLCFALEISNWNRVWFKLMDRLTFWEVSFVYYTWIKCQNQHCLLMLTSQILRSHRMKWRNLRSANLYRVLFAFLHKLQVFSV